MRLDLQALRSAVNIGDVLAAAGVEPPRGKRMRCPLHQGDNPSACVILDDGRRYFCHACGAHGDVFALVMELHNVNFKAAVGIVARIAGLDAALSPHVSTHELLRRNKINRRRGALRAWREWRLTDHVVDAERLERQARRLGERLTRARTDGDAATEDLCWAMLARACHARDRADWQACLLAESSEPAWLNQWRAEACGGGEG